MCVNCQGNGYIAIHPNTHLHTPILSLPVCYLGNNTVPRRDQQCPNQAPFHPYSQSLPVCEGGGMAVASTALQETPWSILFQVVQEASYLIPSEC